MTPKNELDWKEYEAITQYIYAALGQQYGIKVSGYGRNCKVKGRSGISYQIDVLTEQSNGEETHRSAIECKFLKGKVTNDTVMKLLGVMEDTGIESGIIVCKTGFTRDTLQYAAHKGIKLVELREARETDSDFNRTLEIGTLEIPMKIMRTRTHITLIDLGTKVITNEDEIMAMYYVRLLDSQGREKPFSTYLSQFSDELRSRDGLLKTTTIDIATGETFYWKLSGKTIAIEKIAISGFFSKTDLGTTRAFRLTDQVWMIMDELFDERKLTLSRSGLIWNPGAS